MPTKENGATGLLLLLLLLTLSGTFTLAFHGVPPPSSNNNKLVFVPCIALKNLPSPGTAVSTTVAGCSICIVVDPQGFVHALGNKCPPMQQPVLAASVNITNATIQDPVFGTKFSLTTGQVVGDWCPRFPPLLSAMVSEPTPIPTFSLRQRNGRIEVELLMMRSDDGHDDQHDE